MQKEIAKIFKKNFGRTPLTQRLNDIMGEAIELSRFTDLSNLKEETGDLLATTIMLCEECGWDHQDLILNTLRKIEHRKKQYLTLGRKTKVALLGGAFDPITKGHLHVANLVLNTSKTFDEVWFMPAYKHIFNKKMASVKHRCNMIEVAIKSDGRLKLFEYEIKKKLRGETYQTAKLLLNEDFAKNEFDFSWIMGQDNANSFNTWINYKILEKMIRFVIVPRAGYKNVPKNAWYLKSPHIFLQNEKPMYCSSTEIRNTIKKRPPPFQLTSLEKWVHSEVISYIRKNGLYL